MEGRPGGGERSDNRWSDRPGVREAWQLVRGSDLRLRDVVNILDGRRLGVVNDLELDLVSGRILALVVPGPGRFLGLFGRDSDYIIPWERIRKIGSDVILVEMPSLAEPALR
jgi:YlmC/YmxH family sporulation protein